MREIQPLVKNLRQFPLHIPPIKDIVYTRRMKHPTTPISLIAPLTRVLAVVGVTLALAACTSTPHLADGRRLWSAKVAPSLAGGNMLVVFMPDEWPARMPVEDQDSYASWASLLEEFVKGSTVLKEVRRADFRTADDVFYGRGLPVNEYTLLFVRGDGLALYAHEPIFDGAVYDYAEAFLAGKENEQSWSSRLHSGESEANMPRSLKVARLSPMQAVAVAPPATPYPGPVIPPPAPIPAP